MFPREGFKILSSSYFLKILFYIVIVSYIMSFKVEIFNSSPTTFILIWDLQPIDKDYDTFNCHDIPQVQHLKIYKTPTRVTCLHFPFAIPLVLDWLTKITHFLPIVREIIWTSQKVFKHHGYLHDTTRLWTTNYLNLRNISKECAHDGLVSGFIACS